MHDYEYMVHPITTVVNSVVAFSAELDVIQEQRYYRHSETSARVSNCEHSYCSTGRSLLHCCIATHNELTMALPQSKKVDPDD